MQINLLSNRHSVVQYNLEIIDFYENRIYYYLYITLQIIIYNILICFSLPDTFSTLRHMINSLNQMAFIFFPAEHDVKVGSLYTPP
jgi:hypothetical protein